MTPDELAALCAAAMPDERLTRGELAFLCFGENDDVVGDRTGAATFRIEEHAGGTIAWLTLVAVEPPAQGRGLGKQLVRTVADRARQRGATVLLLASAIPRYLWPGVDVANTRAGMLFESLGFTRNGLAHNMAIDTTFRSPAPSGVVIERETTEGAAALAAEHFPNWVPELGTSAAKGTAFAARDASGETIAFGCHSVNRAGWIGPMATKPDLQGRGVGSATLAAVCADLDERGIATGEVAWVSNLRFYGKCGARVSRVFQGGHLAL